jgi:hypothetical protein
MSPRLAVLAALLAIAGCAHERVVIETVEVKVPVPVPCVVKLDELPALPAEQESPAPDYFEAMKRALASLELMKGWARKAQVASSACQIGKGTP